MALAPGNKLGPYDVMAPLGAGGMGEVWRARDTRLGRDVALKVLPAGSLGDESARARLLHEARLASRLNHPNVCTVHEVGEAEGQTYVAMELVAGESLSARIANGALPLEQVLRYGGQMADALAHAHGHGIVHRDLKSANVVITPDGRAKVLDFGLAKGLTGAELAEATTISKGTSSGFGEVMGTLPYMAPEQLHGRPADTRSDLWALGVVLHEMVSGRRPFQGRTAFELSSAILGGAPAKLPTTVPPGLRGVIERCLAKEPGERFQHAGEVRAALEALHSGDVVPLPQAGTQPAARRRWPIVLVTLAAVVVVVAALDVGGLRGRLLGRGVAPTGAIRLAVLPFTNLSADPEQEYPSDGLTQVWAETYERELGGSGAGVPARHRAEPQLSGRAGLVRAPSEQPPAHGRG